MKGLAIAAGPFFIELDKNNIVLYLVVTIFILIFALNVKQKDMSKKQTAIYLTVRVDIEHDENLTGEELEEVLNDVTSVCDYNFTHKDDQTEIVGTEICGTNDGLIN